MRVRFLPRKYGEGVCYDSPYIFEVPCCKDGRTLGDEAANICNTCAGGITRTSASTRSITAAIEPMDIGKCGVFPVPHNATNERALCCTIHLHPTCYEGVLNKIIGTCAIPEQTADAVIRTNELRINVTKCVRIFDRRFCRFADTKNAACITRTTLCCGNLHMNVCVDIRKCIHTAVRRTNQTSK
jgi:hypothetical protein